MKKLILIHCILLCISCKKEKFDIVNRNGNKIIALGHGGMGPSSIYPMDSYESLTKCLRLGGDGTELDVQMTRDSVLVVYHNKDLSDNTNHNGCITSLDWSEVKTARYKQIPYLNYSIISLEDFFSNVENPDRFNYTFDCKWYPENGYNSQFYESFINALTRIVHAHQLENNVYIESQNLDFLKLFKYKKPAYKLFIYPPTFESGLDIAMSLGLYGITLSTKDITKEQIKIAHDNNLWVTIWSVHTEADNKEAIRKNPDIIQTDKLKNLVKLLKE